MRPDQFSKSSPHAESLPNRLHGCCMPCTPCVAALWLCYRIFMPVRKPESSRPLGQRAYHRGGNRNRFLLLGIHCGGGVLVAVLMAYFLDPVVTGLEKLFIPRALGSLIVVLITLALLVVLAWSLVQRVDQFGADWPQISRANCAQAVAAN